MADAIDQGCEREALDRAIALQLRRPEGPKPMGFCHWCEAELADAEGRWCDAQCRDDWQRGHG